MIRSLEAEWLDELAADDPRAVRARRDLRLVNRIMGHGRVVAAALRPVSLDARRIAEIGAGDGTLLLSIANRLKWPSGAQLVLVDREPAVTAATSASYRARGLSVSIEAADVFDWLAHDERPFDAIVANLFLHHFGQEDLARLFALAAKRCRAFVACEPRRAALPLAGSRLLGLLGCNAVTRHDAVISVRAGFVGQELSASWPADSGWTLDEHPAGLFSHLFTAENRGLSPVSGKNPGQTTVSA